VLGQLVTDLVVLGNDDHLDDHVWFLLSSQATIQRIQLTHGKETLKRFKEKQH